MAVYNRWRLINCTRASLIGATAAAAVVLGLVWARTGARRAGLMPPRVEVRPIQIVADGYDTATLVFDPPAGQRLGGLPRVSFVNARGAALEEVTAGSARIRAGVAPGRIGVQVEFAGLAAAYVEVNAVLDVRDRFGDGTPDFLRLDDERDRQAFRRWFTYLAEAQYLQPPAARPAEIDDCAALIRYAYREALHAHDQAWTAGAPLPVIPAFDSVGKYQYPYTPLAAMLFRVRPGPFRASDLGEGTFAQFADAQTLWRRNTHRVSRDLSRAAAGDLLFFRQEEGREPFHSMIYLGESQFDDDGRRYVLYHTGPDGGSPGEIRRPAVEELLRFPQPEWRPVPGNPAFLGVFRWNILRKDSDDDAFGH